MTVYSPLSLERIRSNFTRERSYHVPPLVWVGVLTGAVLFVSLAGRALVTAVAGRVTRISQFSLPDSFTIQLNALKFALTNKSFLVQAMVMPNCERVSFHQEIPAHCCLVHDTKFNHSAVRLFCGNGYGTKKRKGSTVLGAHTTATAPAKEENTRSGQ
jgi:hypothetical protein